MDLKYIERTKQIMKENGMNINDDVLVLNCTIIYITGQRDELAEMINNTKQLIA